MDVREKLVDLLDEAEEWADHKCDELDCEKCPAGKMKGNCVQLLMVDRLIAHGVTVQEWIPASEPPKDDLPVLVTCGKGYRPFVARYDLIWKRWRVSHTLKITHWQPLPSTRDFPQPPK